MGSEEVTDAQICPFSLVSFSQSKILDLKLNNALHENSNAIGLQPYKHMHAHSLHCELHAHIIKFPPKKTGKSFYKQHPPKKL